ELLLTVALFPLEFTLVPLFPIVEDTLFCLALVLASLLKSERTLVEVLAVLSREIVFPVALVTVERPSLFCRILLLVVARLLLFNLLLSLRFTTPFTFLETPRLLSKACLFLTEAFLEV